MRYLEKHGSINNRELRRLSDITYDQATYFFNRMLKAGRLLRRIFPPLLGRLLRITLSNH